MSYTITVTQSQPSVTVYQSSSPLVWTSTVLPGGGLATAVDLANEVVRAEAAEAAKATDSSVVHNTGNETVAGVKTFTSAPVVPAASFPESAVANLTADLAAKVTGVTAGDVTITIGGTATAPTVKVTGGTFDAAGAASAAQTAAQNFASNALATALAGLAPAEFPAGAQGSGLTHSGIGQTVGGVVVTSGMRVLDTASGVSSGLWVAAAGAWARPTDFATGSNAQGKLIDVAGGSVWLCVSNAVVTVDTTSQVWAQIDASVIQAGSGLSKSGNTIALALTKALITATGLTYSDVGADVAGAAAGVLATSVQKANNGNDFADPGSTRANLHVPILTSCQAVALGNITLSGTQTVDGYAAGAGDQILCAGQTTGSQNGPWVVAAGAWTRPTDYASGAVVKGRTVQVNAGSSANVGLWIMATTTSVTVDTTATSWQMNGSGTYALLTEPIAVAETARAEAAEATFVVHAPPPSGDTTGVTDTAALQALLTAATTAGGGRVIIQSGLYWTTGLVEDSLAWLDGPGEGACTIKLANGANQHVIRSKNFENYVPGFTTATLAAGTPVTSLAVTALTHSVAINDVIEIGDTGISTTATGTSAIGATSIAVASFTPSTAITPGKGAKLNPSFTTGSYAPSPQGFAVSGVRIDGNSANNTTGMGIAFFGYRYRVGVGKDVQIFKAASGGFFGSGTNGSTTTYPNGQVETHIGSLYVAQCGGVGFHYEGTHDGYCDWLIVRSCTGNGAEVSGLDGGYCHSYGNAQGFVVQGNARWDHVQPENNTHEGLVVPGAGTITNSIRRVTCYGNWTSGPAVTNYSVVITAAINIDDLYVSATNGESGVSAIGATGLRILQATIHGNSVTNTIGLDISSDKISVTADDVQLFPLAIRRYGHNGRFRFGGTNCSSTFYYEPDTTGDGNSIDVTYNATGGGQTPWTLTGSPLPANTYRLMSNGSVVKQFFQDATGLNSAQVLRRSIVPISTAVTLGSAAGTDYVCLISTGGVPTLPTAVGNTNLYTLKNISAANVTPGTTSSQTIEGGPPGPLTPGTSLDLISDNANWRAV